MNKTGWIAILGTGVVLALILLVSNFNVQININSKGDEVSAGQQATGAAQVNSMADHHGGGVSVDAAVFNGLIGKPAPDFTLESYNGKKITLSGLKGKNVILFFNEGLMCYPACWNQIAAFGKDTELQNKAVVLNITVDPKNNWKQAIDKMPELAGSTVLFDSNRQVSQQYGVLTLPSSMHKGQFPGHSYVLINKEGIIKFARDDVQMAVRNQELAGEVDKL
ncbi:redoxin domain-containing protein [Candidatus Daviesbacteria bacterium]|nr:redoxin domain-containing protein [Candidatus Daviesbacteria bacterium]